MILKTNTPQPNARQRIRRGAEIALVGVSMGIAVVLIRAFTQEGSLGQWLWLLGAAALIGVFHYMLRASVRRPSSTPRRPLRTPRPSANDLFANELDRRWTGLADPVDTPDPRLRQRE